MARTATKQTSTISDADINAAMERHTAYAEMFGLKLDGQPITGKRLFASIVGQLVVSLVGGFIGLHMASALAMGVLTLTGSSFIALAIFILGYAVLSAVAIIAGSKFARYITTGGIDRDYQNLKARFFKRSEIETDYEAVKTKVRRNFKAA